MIDDLGRLAAGFFVLLLFGVAASIVYINGVTAGDCRVRAEYALTAADTLAVARAHPKCASHLFVEVK